MKQPFFARHALLILMGVFFFVPFALRGARQSLQSMKNDVKDWLPSSYDETGDLNWFKEHFLGEQFVVVSWDGCHGDESDALFRTFMAKLLPSKTPSEVKKQLLAQEGIEGPLREAPLAPPSGLDSDRGGVSRQLDDSRVRARAPRDMQP